MNKQLEGIKIAESEPIQERYAKLFLAYWVVLHAFSPSADFFQTQLFQKILSGIPSECQTVWIQTRRNLCPNCLLRLSVDNTSR